MPESNRINAPRFEYRAGSEAVPKWRGHLLEGDPSWVPPNRPRLLINTRFDGGGLKARKGLTQYGGGYFHATDAEIRHVCDHHMTTGKRLWIITNGCPGVDPTTGYSLAHLDHEQYPIAQRAVYYELVVVDIKVAEFDGDPFVGAGDQLLKIQMLPVPYGTEAISLSGYSQDTLITTVTDNITCLQQFDGKLFIGQDGGAGASRIDVYDGITLENDISAINAPTCFGLYRITGGGDAIVAGFAAATNHVRYRPIGVAPGTWTTVAPGAGTVSAVDMLSYKDLLYIASGTTTLWTFDGAALAIVRTIANASIMALAEVQTALNTRVLCFVYRLSTTGQVYIGTYDGTTWNNTEKEITAQFSGISAVYSMKLYRQCLHVAGVQSSSGYIFKSPYIPTDGDISGTWTRYRIQSTNNGSYIGLVVI